MLIEGVYLLDDINLNYYKYPLSFVQKWHRLSAYIMCETSGGGGGCRWL